MFVLAAIAVFVWGYLGTPWGYLGGILPEYTFQNIGSLFLHRFIPCGRGDPADCRDLFVKAERQATDAPERTFLRGRVGVWIFAAPLI